MKPKLPALDASARAASLPNRIKIRTCKLPRDFFQAPGRSESLKQSRISRKSTCDDDLQPPGTPSFRVSREDSRELVRSRQRNETAFAQSPCSLEEFLPSQGRTLNLRRRVQQEVSKMARLLELPPICSHRVSLQL